MIKELRSQAHVKVCLWNSTIEDTLAGVYRSYYHNVGQTRVNHVCDRLGFDPDKGVVRCIIYRISFRSPIADQHEVVLQ